MATKPKRPTAAQLDVLRKMRDGWELIIRERHGGSRNAPPYTICEINRERVATSTVSAMRRAKLIERAFVFGDRAEQYRLTNAGRAALEQP